MSPVRLNERTLKIIFFLTVLAYLFLFGVESLTRDRRFDPDSMDYVDVARNVSSGLGLVHFAIGFNEPHFSPDTPIPAPFTAQAPGYPLAIALVSLLGISHIDAALLVSLVGYGIILITVFLLTRTLYNDSSAMLATGVLLFLSPLREISYSALSETLSIAFVLLSLYYQTRESRSDLEEIVNPLVAGLFCGLAFATRYALFPLVLAGLIFLIIVHRQNPIRDGFLFALPFAFSAGAIAVRNWMVSGSPSGVLRNPATYGVEEGLRRTVNLLFSSMGLIDEYSEVGIVALFLFFVAFVVAKRWQFKEIWNNLTNSKLAILPLWILVYLAFLVVVSSQTYFDLVDRTVLPATVTLALLGSMAVIRATKPPLAQVIYFCIIVGTLADMNKVNALMQKPAITDPQFVSMRRFAWIGTETSDSRRAWIATKTTSRDLLIAEDAVDITFFLRRTKVISFSRYPYGAYPEYSLWMEFVERHCGEYDHVYLFLQQLPMEESESQRLYGPLITDLLHGRTENYPGIFFRRDLDSNLVYEIFDECLNSQ